MPLFVKDRQAEPETRSLLPISPVSEKPEKTSLKRKEKSEMLKSLAAQEKQQQRDLQELQSRESPNDGLQMPRWNTAPKLTQHTLRYTALYEDGLCEIVKGIYSFTIQFNDIGYQIAGLEEQERIFGDYCMLLNYFSPNVCLQITVRNRLRNLSTFQDQITLPFYPDDCQKYRDDYNQMLKRKSLQGDNSIERDKYFTVTFMAEGHKQALSTAARIKADLKSMCRKIGCGCREMSGKDRFLLLQDFFREPEYAWDYRELLASGLTTKDFIAPEMLDFSPPSHYIQQTDGKRQYGQTMYIRSLPTDLEDTLIAAISELDCQLTVNIFIQPIAQDKALDLVKGQRARMDLQKIQVQQKNLKSNMPMEAIPFELQYCMDEADLLIEDMQKRDQRLFRVTLLVHTIADSLEELSDNVYKIKAAAQRCNCNISNLEEQQEAALNSVLPLGACHVEKERNLTTGATGILIPFTTQEILNPNGIYYGQNALSRNLIMVDRGALKNGNAVILGVSGSGKSFKGKEEMACVLMRNPRDEVIVIDPENEYSELARIMNGQVIDISASSVNHLNPFDMDDDYGDDENPLHLKGEFILSLCESLIGELNAISKSILDSCLRLVYEPYFASGMNPEHLPTLVDFHQVLKKHPAPEADILATSLDLYVNGSLSAFAHKTNVNTKNRFIVYNIMRLGKMLKTPGMLVVLDQIWNRVIENQRRGVRTWVYADEMQVFFKNEFSASYFSNIWKRFRKRGAFATGLTQNVEEVLLSDDARFMLANSEFVIMLDQARGDREALAELLGISPEQMHYITNADQGNGLLRVGSSMIPFEDDFPKDTALYRAMTTKPSETLPVEQAMAAAN